MAQWTSAPRIPGSGPDRGPDKPESTADSPAPVRSSRRVPIDRLLSVVVLSPAQATLVAAQVLDAVDLRGTVDGTRTADADLWVVTLSLSGEVDVAPARDGAGTGVNALLEQLGQNARRLPAHPRSEQLVLLRRLEETAADPRLEPGARARGLEGALADVLGPGARQRLSGELAALVDAFAHIASSVGVAVDPLAPPTGPRPGPHRAAPMHPAPSRPSSRSQRHRHALGHRGGRSRRTALVVLLLAGVLVGGGYVLLRNQGNGIAGALGRGSDRATPPAAGPSGSAKEHSTPSRPHRRHGVETIAVRHGGAVTGLVLQRTGSCAPGSPCPVKVTVRLRPVAADRSVTWKVGTARSCGSRVTWSPPIAVTAQPGWTTVYASSSVPVRRGSLALVALTTAPARAQSPPVPVTGSSLRCSARHAQR